MNRESRARRPRFGEFVALAALMMSLAALSIDTMLPALPQMGAALAVARANDMQLVVSSVLLGLGVGQLFYGPLSDAVGRKPALLAGFALFLAGTVVTLLADDFSTMLVGRVVQGLGAGGPRIITVALVRDQYSGATMGRVMSFVMSIFVLVPALAPSIGQLLLQTAGWRSIFYMLFAVGAVAMLWCALRQPETLPPERRRPLSLVNLLDAARQVVASRVALGFTLSAGLVFGAFVGYLSSAQQLLQVQYGLGTRFPLMFGTLALAIGAAALLNARLVLRFGMRRLAGIAARALSVVSVLFLLVALAFDGHPPLVLAMLWMYPAFLCIGMLFSNLHALAMEPLGHIAGIGAALVGSGSSLLALPLGVLIGQLYDGTILPLVGCFALLAGGCALTMRWAGGPVQAGHAG